MPLKKRQQVGLGDFAGFSQCPPDRFMNQIVRIGEKFFSNQKGVRSFSVPDQHQRCNNSHSPLAAATPLFMPS